ncbi:MAG TPA: metalloregulator ArsR/SmtB family transcription factor [Armatimonadota bacterium]|nr:metalloregulator ArsR/SmtB family transcription factor [Armatimonadota bacterium]
MITQTKGAFKPNKTVINNRPLICMETLERVAPVIRNAAHPLRLRILDYLQRERDPRTVSQIVEAAEAGQALVSQQLRILKDQGVLGARREGSYVFYSIVEPSVLLLLECIRKHGAQQRSG